MKRRDFLRGILVAGVAPAIVKAENIMRIRPLESGLLVPDFGLSAYDDHAELFRWHAAMAKERISAIQMYENDTTDWEGVIYVY